MRATVLFLGWILCSTAYAETSTLVVTCNGRYENARETIHVRVDRATRKIVQWSADKMADSKTKYMSGLAQNLEESGYESVSSIRTRKGVAILEMLTTGDSFKLAISADLKRGSFAYRDLGSGAGNHSFGLKCTAE